VLRNRFKAGVEIGRLTNDLRQTLAGKEKSRQHGVDFRARRAIDVMVPTSKLCQF
jgi:hypothetical protein